MDSLEIKINELTENPTARVPICLCLDTSGSMTGNPIRELTQGVAKFYAEIKSNKLARYSADICIITFGTEVTKRVDFRDVEKQFVPELQAGGLTPMGQAVIKALDTLDFRKQEYKAVGVDYYQPWLVLMTDGQATDDISLAAQEVSQLVSGRRLTVFPIGIGEGANMTELARFSPGRDPIRLQGLAFAEFFTWLSKSVVKTSASSPGEKISLPDNTKWAPNLPRAGWNHI